MTAQTKGNPQPGRSIGEHGIIGNLETVGLIASDGTIDFLCWPKLDGPTIFAGLLDPEEGGTFELFPFMRDPVAKQIYYPETNILVTRWLSDEASAEVTDFMPHPDTTGTSRMIVRRLRAIRGCVKFRVRCSPRPDYARAVPAVEVHGSEVLFKTDELVLQLSGTAQWHSGEGYAQAEVELQEGEIVNFVLSELHSPVLEPDGVEALLSANIDRWQSWAASSRYKGRWREFVSRSALALKLLTSAEHGSIAAAATFGMPEALGGERNWDYRATWIRDASFTVYAFLRLGYNEEAERFREWLAQRAQAPEQLRVMYRLDGEEADEETELTHLAGYAASKPVRIGNGAHHQAQFDIFGEMMDSIYLCNKYGKATSRQSWEKIVNTVAFVAQHWDSPDAGIWEFRDKNRHLLHSRLMCWVCVDRAIRLAHKRSLPSPIMAWTELRDAIANDIWSNFRHPQYGYFVQEKHGTELDAALLMMPLVRFVSATDPVWLTTLDAIGDALTSDGLVWRYRSGDGLHSTEGAFTTCMFWYVECLARAGRLKDAQLEMEKCLGYANHLGLFSEELDCRGTQLGNFPQALTHLALISAAHFLDRRLDRSSSDEWQP
jgi:GH15 family glucan-1,4-alpha-glucosidase